AVGLAGHEGLEDSLDALRGDRDPGPGVRDNHERPAALTPERDRDRARPIAVGGDPRPRAARAAVAEIVEQIANVVAARLAVLDLLEHRLLSVAQQVEQRLAELAGVGVDPDRRGRELADDRHAVALVLLGEEVEQIVELATELDLGNL